MTIADTIRAKLAAALTPAECSIEDESARHAGHAGSPGGAGETHFRIRIVSAAFAGETRIARHRRIYDILAHELNSGVHALALTTLTPEEAGR